MLILAMGLLWRKSEKLQVLSTIAHMWKEVAFAKLVNVNTESCVAPSLTHLFTRSLRYGILGSE